MLTLADVNTLYPAIQLERASQREMAALQWFMDNHTPVSTRFSRTCA